MLSVVVGSSLLAADEAIQNVCDYLRSPTAGRIGIRGEVVYSQHGWSLASPIRCDEKPLNLLGRTWPWQISFVPIGSSELRASFDSLLLLLAQNVGAEPRVRIVAVVSGVGSLAAANKPGFGPFGSMPAKIAYTEVQKIEILPR